MCIERYVKRYFLQSSHLLTYLFIPNLSFTMSNILCFTRIPKITMFSPRWNNGLLRWVRCVPVPGDAAALFWRGFCGGSSTTVWAPPGDRASDPWSAAWPQKVCQIFDVHSFTFRSCLVTFTFSLGTPFSPWALGRSKLSHRSGRAPLESRRPHHQHPTARNNINNINMLHQRHHTYFTYFTYFTYLTSHTCHTVLSSSSSSSSSNRGEMRFFRKKR